MYRIIALIIICSTSWLTGFTQSVIHEEPAVSRTMDMFVAQAQTLEFIDGWRIQLINTDDRRRMESARSKFGAQFPYIKMTWEHVQPYYQIKVGAYRNKMALEGFLRELKAEFPRAIPVRDRINKAELIE